MAVDRSLSTVQNHKKFRRTGFDSQAHQRQSRSGGSDLLLAPAAHLSFIGQGATADGGRRCGVRPVQPRPDRIYRLGTAAQEARLDAGESAAWILI